MAERTHNKPQFTGKSGKDDRPSQLLSFTFLFDRAITEETEFSQSDRKKTIHLQSNEVTFFHSQKSVWFRQLLKS